MGVRFDNAALTVPVCLAILSAVLLVAAMISACSVAARSAIAEGERAPIEEPAPPDLSDPVSAVAAYTDWISYAYALVDSDVAAHAFSAYEEVRVNSFVMRNFQEGRGIHQMLVDSEYRLESREATTAIVAGSEEWVYRYFDLRTRDYTTPVYTASYDVTYTVIVEEPKGWVVDRVEALAHGELQ